MNKDLRQEIEKILDSVFCLADGSEYDEYLNGDNDADAILSLVYSHLEKKINDKRYRKIAGGYKQKDELGIATNLMWCEASNDMLSEIKQILKEELIGK